MAGDRCIGKTLTPKHKVNILSTRIAYIDNIVKMSEYTDEQIVNIKTESKAEILENIRNIYVGPICAM